MNNSDKEEQIDRLVVWMNEEVENHGVTIGAVSFNFETDGEDRNQAFSSISDFHNDSFEVIIKTCLSRGFIKQQTMGGWNHIALTEDGQARAISVLNADSKRVVTAGDIHIGTLNAHAPTQIGNYNQQDIQHIVQFLQEQIENSDASEADKGEARSRLAAFLEHPLTQTIINGATTIGSAVLGK